MKATSRTFSATQAETAGEATDHPGNRDDDRLGAWGCFESEPRIDVDEAIT